MDPEAHQRGDALSKQVNVTIRRQTWLYKIVYQYERAQQSGSSSVVKQIFLYITHAHMMEMFSKRKDKLKTNVVTL